MLGTSYQPKGKNLDILSEENPSKNIISNKYSDVTLDATLGFIRQVLLEEEIDEKDHEELAVHAMERHFYDILDQKHPPLGSISQVSNRSRAYPNSTDHLPYALGSNFVNTPSLEFNKGVEEGMKFLPSTGKLVLDIEANKVCRSGRCNDSNILVQKNLDVEHEERDICNMAYGSRGKMKSCDVDLDISEGRNCKMFLPYLDESIRNAMYDEVLLDHDNYIQEVANLSITRSETRKRSENDEVEVVDVKTLLLQCSRAVYTNDRPLAEGLIKQIRNQSSIDGNGTQRVVFAFANALEARLMGTGSEAYRRIIARRIPTSDYLKVVHLYITACPFERICIYYANQTILNLAEKASKLHVIDFGIGLGFQWPSLIQYLSTQNGKAIKLLRITGIDFPRPGFRPAEMVEEVGWRLEDYAKSFNVPLEYRGIASQWEAISVDDLKITEDEVLVVTCLYHFREVPDEAIAMDSPRNRVLKLIQQMKPHVFIQRVVSIRSFSPFFITRFKQALDFYSSLFELFDTLVPRDNKERQLIETAMLGRDIMNVVACEGSDWIMRPESYKQWHLRNLRVGFEQLPLDPAIMRECHKKMREVCKNNILFMEEARNWLIQGWHGRIFFALSTWKSKLA